MPTSHALRPKKIDGRVTRAERLREERRGQVLEAAERLFAEKGYHATSVNDIIESADIARGTFYLYFESKRAIFEELLDRLFVTLSATVKRIDVSPGSPPPIEQMHATVDRIFYALKAQRPMARILIREAVGLDVEFDRKLADFYGRVHELIVTALRNGIAMGLVRPCDPEVVAWCALGSVKEVIDHVFVVDDGEAVRDLRSLGRSMIDFVLGGVFR